MLKTTHADKRVPIELKATSLLIPLTLACEFLVQHHIPRLQKKKKRSGLKRLHTLKGTN